MAEKNLVKSTVFCSLVAISHIYYSEILQDISSTDRTNTRLDYLLTLKELFAQSVPKK